VSSDLDLRPVEVSLAMLAALDEAQYQATWLDHSLENPHNWPFAIIERCRHDVAQALGVEVPRYIGSDDDGEAT
jgi:hypothetical protein